MGYIVVVRTVAGLAILVAIDAVVVLAIGPVAAGIVAAEVLLGRKVDNCS
jgi:hypothetical protein